MVRGFVAFALVTVVCAAQGPWIGGGQKVSAQSPLVGKWRFTKFGPINGTFEFSADGTYSYSVQHGSRRLAHEGTYRLRPPRTNVSLRGLLGIVELKPTKTLADGAPTDLMIDSTLMDNEQTREYFVVDNVARQYTQGIRTLSLCDTERDWPGCAQTTRIYEVTRP